MLSVAVKHAILAILVILIIHFIIEKHLVEKSYVATFVVDSKDVNTQPTMTPSVTTPTSQPTVIKVQDIQKDEDDLYNFVFKDSNECNMKLSDNPEESSLKRVAKVLTDQDQTSSEFYTLNQYENETAINGGNLFSNINGFDNAFTMFSPV